MYIPMKVVAKKNKNRYPFRQIVPTKSEILTCTCGNKYIKTRPDQLLCFRCINKVR